MRVAHGHISQAEVAVPCLSKDFDGTWIPELQSLTGGSLIKGPCLLQHNVVVYHQNKLYFTVDDEVAGVGEDVTFTFYGLNASFARMTHSKAVEVMGSFKATGTLTLQNC
ncbi:g5308 [Coccomyxa elongata]